MPKLAANVSMLFAEVRLRRLDRCEYNPVGDTREGLKWARRYLS
jgi:hydroxypyruvate isomerase